MEPSLVLRDPVHFRMHDVINVNVFAAGVALVLLGAMILVGVIVFVISFGPGLVQIGLSLCLGLYSAMVFLLTPFANNYYVSRHVRRSILRPKGDGETYLVQITLSPRVYGGLRGFLEDADDVGYLRFTEEGLEFFGDSITIQLPFEDMEGIEDVNVGIRGLWIVGRRVRVSTPALPPYVGMEFLDRDGLGVRRTRQISESIIHALMRGSRLSPQS